MKNFLFGVVVGVVATYVYLTPGGYFRELANDFWARASAPPASQHRAP